jgi:hypothetical protein
MHPGARSNQLEALEAGMALFADDDVVVDGDAQRLGGVDDPLGLFVERGT